MYILLVLLYYWCAVVILLLLLYFLLLLIKEILNQIDCVVSLEIDLGSVSWSLQQFLGSRGWLKVKS